MEKNINQRLKEMEIKKIKAFGYSFSMGMAILLTIAIWKDFIFPFKVIVAFMLLFHLFSAFFNYRMLYPMHTLTSFVGKILGNLLTTVIFTIVFYLLFTPIVIVLRWFKKDVIKNISDSPKWVPIPDKQNNPQRVERLF